MGIYLKSEHYKGFFEILRLEQGMGKRGMKQRLILGYLKKHLINCLNQKEKFKRDPEKIFMLNQLRFEKSYHEFVVDIRRISDMAEELWRQSLKNYKILSMQQLMRQISEMFLALWRKFEDMEDMNAELLIIFARFCDSVMSFELEAENLYLKGMAILNSIKL